MILKSILLEYLLRQLLIRSSYEKLKNCQKKGLSLFSQFSIKSLLK